MSHATRRPKLLPWQGTAVQTNPAGVVCPWQTGELQQTHGCGGCCPGGWCSWPSQPPLVLRGQILISAVPVVCVPAKGIDASRKGTHPGTAPSGADTHPDAGNKSGQPPQYHLHPTQSFDITVSLRNEQVPNISTDGTPLAHAPSMPACSYHTVCKHSEVDDTLGLGTHRPKTPSQEPQPHAGHLTKRLVATPRDGQDKGIPAVRLSKCGLQGACRQSCGHRQPVCSQLCFSTAHWRL